MARPTKEDSIYRVSIHRNGGHNYATTHEYDIVEGKRKYRYVNWGTYTDADNKFHPSHNYLLATPEQRARLIFPAGWDMSEATKATDAPKRGRKACADEDTNRLYGASWLLERIADKTGLRDDLMVVFDGDKSKVDDVLTLAYFPYITGFSYNRLFRGQSIDWFPSVHKMTPDWITRFTQSITEAQRMELFRLRARRLEPGELCAVDSTSRSAYGDSLADIHWGKNKDRLPLPQTTEVVVYSLSSHMPVYYRTFPGNIPDSRSVETLLTDLSHAGFPKVTLITDRGYESIQNLERYILADQAMIMCVSVRQKIVADKIREIGAFDGRPACMTIDPGTRLYYKQYDEEYKVLGGYGAEHKAKRMKLNLYFSAERRARELTNMDVEIETQRIALQQLLDSKMPMDDDETAKRNYGWFVFETDEDRTIKSFAEDSKKIERARLLTGFFANMTLVVKKTAMEALAGYGLRDEQEKYFQQMKGQMVCSRQRNWSEDGKTGRLFILFVGLILASVVRHTWKTTSLNKAFNSSQGILDEMRPIRIIEHKGKAPFVTPFVGKQIDICDAFGFTVPDGCGKNYTSKKVREKRRGRPAKSKSTQLDG